jgi:hypothetical protein
MNFQYYYNHWVLPWGLLPLAIGGLLFSAAVIWSFVWKGLALWKAARNGHRNWFIALLFINTLGILEILYIYVFSKRAKPIR